MSIFPYTACILSTQTVAYSSQERPPSTCVSSCRMWSSTISEYIPCGRNGRLFQTADHEQPKQSRHLKKPSIHSDDDDDDCQFVGHSEHPWESHNNIMPAMATCWDSHFAKPDQETEVQNRWHWKGEKKRRTKINKMVKPCKRVQSQRHVKKKWRSTVHTDPSIDPFIVCACVCACMCVCACIPAHTYVCSSEVSYADDLITLASYTTLFQPFCTNTQLQAWKGNQSGCDLRSIFPTHSLRPTEAQLVRQTYPDPEEWQTFLFFFVSLLNV